MSESKKPSSVVGLRNVVYCVMVDPDKEEYATEVKSLTGAIDAKISTPTSTDTQYADDGAFDVMDSEGDTAVDLKVVDVPMHIRAELLGKEVDANGVVLDTIDTAAPYVALGFKGLKANKKGERYVWLYKGKFSLGEENFHTKEDKGTFQEPTLKGTFVNRIKDGRKKATIDSDVEGINQEVINHWFDSVYESVDADA